MFTPLLEIDPEIWHTCSVSLYPAVDESFFCREKYVYTHIYFYHRTLSALPHDCLPTLEAGTNPNPNSNLHAMQYPVLGCCRF